MNISIIVFVICNLVWINMFEFALFKLMYMLYSVDFNRKLLVDFVIGLDKFIMFIIEWVIVYKLMGLKWGRFIYNIIWDYNGRGDILVYWIK